MKTSLKYSFILLLVLGFYSAFAVEFPQPRGKHLVHDYIGFFSPADQQFLDQKLVNFANTSSNQIALVVIDDLQGLEPADYAIQLANEWKIGQANEDNGVLILLKPVGRTGTRHAFIAVGEGLEGVIPDAVANRIVDNEMIPYFKQNNYLQGVEAAINTLTSLAINEFNSDEYMNRSASKEEGAPLAALLLILGTFLFVFIVPARNAYSYSRSHNMAFWAAFWLLMGSGRNSSFGSGGSYHSGGFWGGSGGGSGFGGGGFGGFGGGSFGGGGAGGSW